MQGAESRLGSGESMKLLMRNYLCVVGLLMAGCGRQDAAQSPTPAVAAVTRADGVLDRPDAVIVRSNAPLIQLNAEITQSRAMLKQQLALPADQAESGVIRNLRRRLATLGDEQELSNIVQRLSSTNLADQSQALEDARVVGGKVMIHALVAVLEDQRPGGRILSDVGVPPPRQAAAEILAGLLPDSPLQIKEARFQRDDEIEEFKQWWKTNGSVRIK